MRVSGTRWAIFCLVPAAQAALTCGFMGCVVEGRRTHYCVHGLTLRSIALYSPTSSICIPADESLSAKRSNCIRERQTISIQRRHDTSPAFTKQAGFATQGIRWLGWQAYKIAQAKRSLQRVTVCKISTRPLKLYRSHCVLPSSSLFKNSFEGLFSFASSSRQNPSVPTTGLQRTMIVSPP